MCTTVTGYNCLNTYQIEYTYSAPKIEINVIFFQLIFIAKHITY